MLWIFCACVCQLKENFDRQDDTKKSWNFSQGNYKPQSLESRVVMLCGELGNTDLLGEARFNVA